MAPMCGWLRAARILASRSKRTRRSVSLVKMSGRSLMATSRSSWRSRARYTSPIPPLPSRSTIVYGPNLSPDQRHSLRCCRHRRNRRRAISVAVGLARKKTVCFGVRGEQQSHFVAQLHVIFAFDRHIGVAFGLRQRHRGIEHGKHTIQTFAGHLRCFPVMDRGRRSEVEVHGTATRARASSHA